MSPSKIVLFACVIPVAALSVILVAPFDVASRHIEKAEKSPRLSRFDRLIRQNALRMIEDGRRIFRFDTFGDEAFWGDTLKLHQAVEGENHGGVGPGLTPTMALAAGLKVDADALPGNVRAGLKHGSVNLDDPGTTLELLQLKAVVGLTGFFNPDGSLSSIRIQCALRSRRPRPLG